jgi:DNA-binding IclR family transcriptional regulator
VKDPQDYNVRAVERALQILACFGDEHPERGVTEIAQEVGLHKATVHRIMTTLLNYGFLERGAGESRYRLGVRLAELGCKVFRRLDVRREALPVMAQLVEQWDEACDLGLYDQGQVLYIEVLRSNHALTIAAAVGQRLPAHCTASGKLFLAYLPPDELEAELSRPLASYTNKTLTSPALLRQQFEAIRRQGYGWDDEEYEAGIRAVSAPIRNYEGQTVAALSMPGPASRLTPERLPQVAQALQEGAQAVSRRLGWRPDLEAGSEAELVAR